MSKSARAEAARVLRRVLEAIGRGELTAPAAMVRRLEGATAALEAEATTRRKGTREPPTGA